MSVTSPSEVRAPRQWGRVVPAGITGWRPVRLVERNVLAYRRMWPAFVVGFFEPVLYLFSIGIGVGELVGDLPGPGGEPVSYEAFVAPGLFAAAAMNGSVFDTTFNFFVKYKYLHTYDGILATPISVADVAAGEVLWALLRGTLYSGSFLLTMAAMGLVTSWWAVLALPAAALIGVAFAAVGLAAATCMRSFVDFDLVNLAVVPMFLFAATFFPLERYPEAVQWLVRATPLYHGVALVRSLTLGHVEATLAGHAVYLAVMGLLGVAVARRRLARLLQP